LKQAQKIASKKARNVVLFMAKQIKDSFPSLQQLMMEKLLCHPTVKGWLSYLVDIAKFKQSQHILGNLIKRWTNISSCRLTIV
jgi:hypothetical protein